jgi:hypothetical protein
MASAGTVTVDFAAEVARFNSQLRSVNASLSRVESGFSNLQRVAGTFARVFTGAVLVNFARQAFIAADAINDAAKRAGVAVDSFSRLKFAAEQTDIEFNTLVTSIRQFQTNLSQANSGAASAVNTFSLLSLRAEQFKNLALEQQLGLVADAFQQIVDPADRVRIATELFGRSGQDLIPLLEQGSAGIAKLTAEADRLGVTMNKAAVEGIEVADAALKRLKATVEGFGTKFLAGLSIAFLGTGDAVEEINVKVGELARQRDLLLARGAGTKGSPLETALARINAQIDALLQKQKGLVGLADSVFGVRTPELPEITVDVPKPDLTFLNQFTAAEQAAEAFEQEIADMQARHELKLEITRNVEKEITAAIAEEQRQRLALTIEAEDARFQAVGEAQARIAAVHQGAMTAGLELLRVLAGRSKTAALALIAVNRGLQIAQAVQNTAAGVTAVLADPTIPFYAKPGAIAFVKAIGAAQVALIAATGFAEARNVSGGGGLPLGSPHNPVFTQQQGQEPTFGASSQSAVQVIIQGDVFSSQETVDYLIGQIAEAVSGRDVIVVQPGTLQADLIRNG